MAEILENSHFLQENYRFLSDCFKAMGELNLALEYLQKVFLITLFLFSSLFYLS